MTDSVLFDKLLKLRLPAFRDGLREQQNNPQYIDLTFEERLSLLVDQECIRRQDNHIRIALHKAGFPIQAAPEDLDLSPERGLDRKQILELYQCNWIGSHLNLLVLGPTGSGKSFTACSLGTAAVRLGYSVPIFILFVCCIRLKTPDRMSLIPTCCAPSHAPISSSWTIGCVTRSHRPVPRIFWKFSMIASVIHLPL